MTQIGPEADVAVTTERQTDVPEWLGLGDAVLYPTFHYDLYRVRNRIPVIEAYPMRLHRCCRVQRESVCPVFGHMNALGDVLGNFGDYVGH